MTNDYTQYLSDEDKNALEQLNALYIAEHEALSQKHRDEFAALNNRFELSCLPLELKAMEAKRKVLTDKVSTSAFSAGDWKK